MLAVGIDVFEVERPKRGERRRGGKSDRIDALLAAKKVLANDGLSRPRTGGTRQALSALLVAYRSCIAERTARSTRCTRLHTTAPAALREQLGTGSGKQLAARVLKLRAGAAPRTAEQISLELLRDYAERAADADTPRRRLQGEARRARPKPRRRALNEPGIGPISAAKLLVCDAHRLTGEAAFARCNGTAPLPASSGQTVRHRLSRGGDRQANNAIHTIALSRARCDAKTLTPLRE